MPETFSARHLVRNKVKLAPAGARRRCWKSPFQVDRRQPEQFAQHMHGFLLPLRAKKRALCPALIALYAAMWLGTGMHDALERHEVCEHGERVHAESAPSMADHPTAKDHSNAPFVAASAGWPGPAHDDDHAHCDVDQCHDDAVSPAVMQRVVARPMPTTLFAAVATPADAQVVYDVLLSAPKQSPPFHA